MDKHQAEVRAFAESMQEIIGMENSNEGQNGEQILISPVPLCRSGYHVCQHLFGIFTNKTTKAVEVLW